MRLKAIVIFIVATTILNNVGADGVESSEEVSSGVMGKIKNGFKMATKLLGLDRAQGVAQLVSETFGGGSHHNPKYKKGSNDQNSQNLFSGFFRLLGLDAGKLGAIAINGFIFIAQMISTSFKLGAREKVAYQRNFNGDSPMDWFTNNQKLKKLIETAKDENLPEKIIGYVQDRASEDDTACIQLLICKTAPFIWGMQQSLNVSPSSKPKSKKKEKLKASDPMFKTLPTMENVIENGDQCEDKYPMCQYLE